MPIDYAMVSKCWRRNKSNLTRARNQSDWYKVIDVCEQAFADFREYGYPDDWNLFRIAAMDAYSQLRYSGDLDDREEAQNRATIARVNALN